MLIVDTIIGKPYTLFQLSRFLDNCFQNFHETLLIVGKRENVLEMLILNTAQSELSQLIELTLIGQFILTK